MIFRTQVNIYYLLRAFPITGKNVRNCAQLLHKAEKIGKLGCFITRNEFFRLLGFILSVHAITLIY